MLPRVLQLKGLPVDMMTPTGTLVNPAKFNRTCIDVYDATKEGKGTTLYIQNEQGMFTERMLEDETFDVADMLFISYPVYFNSVFDKETTTKYPKAKMLVIYDIGDEAATSYTYSDSLLNAIVRGNKGAGNTTVLTAINMLPSVFSRKYPDTTTLVDISIQGMKG